MPDSTQNNRRSGQAGRLRPPDINYDLLSVQCNEISGNNGGRQRAGQQFGAESRSQKPAKSAGRSRGADGHNIDRDGKTEMQGAISPTKLEDARFLVASMMGVDLDAISYDHRRLMGSEGPASTATQSTPRSLHYSQPDLVAVDSKPLNSGGHQVSSEPRLQEHAGPSGPSVSSKINLEDSSIATSSQISSCAEIPTFTQEMARTASSINQMPRTGSVVELQAGYIDLMLERINKVQVKINIELHIKRGVEKIRAIAMKTEHSSTWKKRMDEIDSKIREIDKKIEFLQTIYNFHKTQIENKTKTPLEEIRQKLLHAPASDGKSNASQPQKLGVVTKPKRSLFTGELRIHIQQIKGFRVDQKDASHTYAVIRADDVQCAKFKISKEPRGEVSLLKLERVGEVEIDFYLLRNNRLCGITWFKLHALEEKIESINSGLFDKAFRTKHAQDDKLGTPVVSAPRGRDRPSSTADLLDHDLSNSDKFPLSIGNSDASISTRICSGLSDLDPAQVPLYGHYKPGKSTSDADAYRPVNTLEGWVPIEPDGSAYIKIQIQRLDAKEPSKGPNMLRRQKQVRKIILHLGHNFVPTPAYHVKKCPICREFLIGNIGYECVACKLSCHKKCKDSIVTACVSRLNSPSYGSSGDLQKAEELYSWHRIRHRFEKYLALSANWCSHCGSMISIGRKVSLRCSTCFIIVHASCKPLVANLCGLPPRFIKDAQIAISASYEKNKGVARIKDHDVSHGVTHSPSIESEMPVKRPPLGRVTPDEGFRAVNSETTIAFEPSPDGGAKTKELTRNEMEKLEPSLPAPDAATRLSDFIFLSVIGRGNFGKVVLAGDIYTRDLYAIKILQKEFIIENDETESIGAEKNVFVLVNKKRHPFLTNLHSCFQTESYIYFVMEFVPGGDLMWHIQHQQFSPELTKFYAVEVFLALEFLHDNDIIYRDLKLDNILLTLSGHIKLADYGLCKSGMGEKSTTTTFCGTPEFMAPEVLLDKPYTRAVDYWAYGVLLYEMLFGLSPFQGNTEDEIFKEIIEKQIDYSPPIDPAAESLLRNLLVRSPQKRLGSGSKGAKEIKKHPYFKDVVWKDYYELKVDPPFKPKQSSRTDVTNFDTEFTQESPVPDKPKRKLTPIEQFAFKGFTYVSDWAEEKREQALAKARHKDTLKREIIDTMIKNGTF